MKAVIFDMDGLLIDTERLYVEAFAEACERMGYECNPDIFKTCIGCNMASQDRIMKDFYGEDFDFMVSYNIMHECMDRYIEEGRLELKEGVVEILNHCKSKGYKIAVASSTVYDKVCRFLKLTNIYHYFDEIITGDMVKNGKPAPDIFLYAAKKLGTKPDETYVFEDSYNGVRAGHAGGFYTIMVPDLLHPDDEMQTIASEIMNTLLNFC